MQPSLIKLFAQFPQPRFWHLWAAVGVLRLLTWLPLPVLYVLGAVVGELAWLLHRQRRKITLRNLHACFPDLNRAAIHSRARGHFRALVIAVFAVGISWWGSKARFARLVRFRNREIFDAARKRGENIIFLAPHFAGLEHGGIFLSVLAPMISMYQHHKNPLLDALIQQHRSRFGIIQFPRNAPSKELGKMIELLKDQHAFYYLPDQDPGRSGASIEDNQPDGKKSVFAPFYSIPTATYAALGRLARLGNATVIPCATFILPWGRGFEIVFNDPLENYPCGDAVRDATTMNAAIESLIAFAPPQYFWSHRRFKSRPQGDALFYD